MKKYILIAGLVLFFGNLHAQVAIGKTTTSTSGLLEFNDDTTNVKGIILPRTTSAIATESGTITFDAISKKILYFDKDFATWKDLTDEGSYTEQIPVASSDVSDGVIIGAEISTAKGVLVLESANKALILPKIANPHINVKNPEPGMICYDTASKTFALFNGTKWHYWK